jgi:hypothetical protein
MPQQATLVSPTNPSVGQTIDPTHQAGRVSIRPAELYGSYSIAALSGVVGAGQSANSPVFCFRWAPVDTTKVALVRKLRFTAGNLATAFTAGGVTIAAFIARGFTVIDTGGAAALTTSGNNQKRRTSMAASANVAGQVLVSGTGVLTAGTRTKDANAFATISTSVVNTAGVVLIPPPGYLVDPTEAGKYPLVLAVNEGIIIEATVPATGTWTFAVDMDWDEGAY